MHHYPTARSFKFVVRRGAAPAHVFVPTQRQDGTSLVEVGPRLVLAPIRVFAGSFGGATLYHEHQFPAICAAVARRANEAAAAHAQRLAA